MQRQSSALFFAFLLLFPFPAIAQIIPDNSFGTESSRTVGDTINNGCISFFQVSEKISTVKNLVKS
ncbi:hypothetical protein QUB75_08515 [Microcoleus sp. K1-B6]|uniref:hypothetical protein n=1 Tax=unclassified Microcoleus TaxID=2642155 RepID=UPI002FD3F483